MNDTREAVLEAIADGPVRGPTIAESLGVSRAAVWKHVEALRVEGFDVESATDGYRLIGVPEYGGSAVEFGLEAPFSIEYHDAVGSTNDRARDLAAEGASDVVVVANEQIGGRGRLGREWVAPPGGVWLSVVCRPAIAPARAPLYTLAASVATTRAVREAGVDARIKWPNDVVVPAGEDGDGSGPAGEDGDGSDGDDRDRTDSDVGYRKLAGVLTEMEGEVDRVEWVAVGIGVNANVDADALPAEATSIRAERTAGGADEGGAAARTGSRAGERGDDVDVDRRAFVQRLLEGFDALRTDIESVVPAWRELATTPGRRVRVDRPDETIRGTAVDVTDRGALVIETGDGRVTVSAGDCEHLRPART